MDVNQTRFHLVYGKADWLPPVAPAFDWNCADSTVGLHQELFVFPKRVGQLPLAVENRRGAGIDRYGNWYWITDGQDEVRFLSEAAALPPVSYEPEFLNTSAAASGNGLNAIASEHFWSAGDQVLECPPRGEFFTPSGPPQPANLIFSGLAVTGDHYLIVGLIKPQGLLIFDLYSGGSPTQLFWPASVPFEPFDFAATSDGGVLLLDRQNKAFWKLDRDFRVQDLSGSTLPGQSTMSGFYPADGSVWPASCASNQVTAEMAVSLATLSDPVAIEALSDGSVLVLENPPGESYSVVHRFRQGSETGASVSLENALARYVNDSPTTQIPHPADVRGYDFAFVAGSSLKSATLGTLYLVDIFGNQSFGFTLAMQNDVLSLTTQAGFFPMRQFGGRALVSAGSQAYYDFQEIWVPLTQQPHALYQVQAKMELPTHAVSGDLSAQPFAFDGKQPGCVWHRVFVDACIPHGASLAIESKAADEPSLLPGVDWQLEPTPYLRSDGAELPYYQSPLTRNSDRVDTWELLLQNAKGRFLQLRLTLKGTRRSTPRLHALRVYYPRFSYLQQYLPAVYRDDPNSASFLDRYLANVEGFYTALEDKIAQVQALFDPRIVPAAYLDWLASWVSIVLDSTWSPSTRRLVLMHAPQMFREHGTKAGVIRAIRLMLEPCPDESFFDETTCNGGPCPNSKAFFSVRLVEEFQTRSAPGVVYGDPTDVGTLRTVAGGAAWTAAQGPGVLNTLYQAYLQTIYADIASLNTAWATSYSSFNDATLTLPPLQPAQSTQAADWRRFLRDALGFTYAPATSSDLATYQVFLQRTYATIGALNTAYALTGANAHSSFTAITLPAVMPSGGALQDWIVFVSKVLPAQQNAHQFRVLVPVALTDSPDVQQTKLGIAQRVADVEKPAHTSFTVRLYWAMFRAGEARVGLDTFLGVGSRFAALVLGKGSLAAGNLAFPDSASVPGRMQLGGRSLAQRCCGRKQERCV
jgi:phage tail-like protein